MSKAAQTIRRPRRKSEMPVQSGLQMAGEALNIFGRVPSSLHLLYYTGTLPFVIAFLYFWFDMSQSAYAQERLFVWSLILPFLFVWMKCWQTVFVKELDGWLYERASAKYGLRGFVRLIVFNAIVQPAGFVVLPLAMVFGLPFMAAAFFFQDVLLSQNLYQEGVLARCAESLRAARQHSGQGFMLIWLLSPWQLGMGFVAVYFLVFLNKYLGVEVATGGDSTLLFLGMAFQVIPLACAVSPFGTLLGIGITTLAFSIPYLLENILGIETSFSHGWQAMLFNTSFVAVVYFMVFMILDPLMKIAMVLRRFQYNSRSGGDDILLTLKEIAHKGGGAALLVPAAFLALLLAPLQSRAQEPMAESAAGEISQSGVLLMQEAERLDAALDSTVQQPRYTWRMPRTLELDKSKKEMPGWLERWKAYIQSIQDKIFNWLEDWINRKDRSSSKGFWNFNMGAAEIIFYLLLVVTVGVLTVLLLKWLRERRSLMVAQTKGEVKTPVNVHDQSVSPDDLPPDEWLELAASLVAAGDYRAAVRALFLGVLSKLGERDFVTLRSYKSNYDYCRELELRARGRQEVIDAFRWLRRLMECTWYGYVPVTVEMWRDFQTKSADLRRDCEPRADQSQRMQGGARE